MTSAAGAMDCAVNFVTTPTAQALPVTLANRQHVLVGTVFLGCNKAASYTLVVASGNCPLSPAGAKLLDNVGGQFVTYSVEFDNKAVRGGISIVSNLLTQTCAAQVARNEQASAGQLSSDVFVDFTGITMLGVGNYSDTLSVTMNLK